MNIIAYNVIVFDLPHEGETVRTVLSTYSGRGARDLAVAEAESEARRETCSKAIVTQQGGRRSGLTLFRAYNEAPIRPPAPTTSAADRIMAELRALRPGFYA